MSIVEKALQKAQAKPERTGTTERAADGAAAPAYQAPASSTDGPHDGVDVIATATAMGRECRGGSVTLDVQRLRNDGRLAPEKLAQQTEEEFRRIKWPVLNAITRREGVAPAVNNIVLVTSAIPGEGKTFNALNLALSIAREGNSNVFLLDLDMRNPTLCNNLGVVPPVDMNEYLSGDGRPEDLLFSIGVDNLLLAGSVTSTNRASELLATRGVEKLFSYIRSIAPQPLVLVDLPPVLATDDALVVAPMIDACLLVLSEGRSRRDSAAEAIALLSEFTLAGIVLNRSRAAIKDYHYSYS